MSYPDNMSIQELNARINQNRLEFSEMCQKDMSEPTTAEINSVRELRKLVRMRDELQSGTIMERPSVCNDIECSCLYRDHTQTFCVGQTPERIDVVDCEEHVNDYQFCIITYLRGWMKARINQYDMSLVAKAMLTGLSTRQAVLNLGWYIEKDFHMDGKVVVFGERKS